MEVEAGWIPLGGGSYCFFFLVKLQTLIVRDPPDLAELPESSFEIRRFSNTTQPKLAFLFLARQHLPLDVLWEHFFEGADSNEYSVYIHTRPGFSFTKHNTACRAFVNRQLQASVQVEWGKPSMIQAERLLLAEALQDPLNERFLLLSDSCIPLFNFNYIYDYVMSSNKSFVDSFYDYKDYQYNVLMDPIVTEDKWRKGSQWFTLTRKHAEMVAEDSKVFSTFVDHCKCFFCKVHDYGTWSGWLTGLLQKAVPSVSRKDDYVSNDTDSTHNCIPDEHYIQTLLAMKDMEGELERRTLTYSRWESSDSKGSRGWHPAAFDAPDIALDFIKEIQGYINVRYDSEYRTEWCSAGGRPRQCFLFARKFTKLAVFELLNIAERYESNIVHVE